MSSLLLGSISATLGLDNSGFRRGIVESEALTATFGQTITTALTNPLLAGIGALKSFGTAVFQASEQLLGMAEGVSRTAALTGVSVETIQSLRNVLSDMGLSAEGADAALTAFNRKLGDAKKDGGATAKSLAQLGVDISNVGTGERALRAIFDQLSRIDDVGQRAAAASEIFDRQFGAQMLAAVDGGAAGIARLNAEMIGLGRTVTSEGIRTLEGLDATVDKLKGTIQGVSNTLLVEFLTGVAGGTADAERSVAELGNTLRRDLVGPAREAGEALVPVVKAIAEIVDGISAIGDLPGIELLGKARNALVDYNALFYQGFFQLGQSDPNANVSQVYSPRQGRPSTGRGK